MVNVSSYSTGPWFFQDLGTFREQRYGFGISKNLETITTKRKMRYRATGFKIKGKTDYQEVYINADIHILPATWSAPSGKDKYLWNFVAKRDSSRRSYVAGMVDVNTSTSWASPEIIDFKLYQTLGTSKPYSNLFWVKIAVYRVPGTWTFRFKQLSRQTTIRDDDTQENEPNIPFFKNDKDGSSVSFYESSTSNESSFHTDQVDTSDCWLDYTRASWLRWKYQPDAQTESYCQSDAVRAAVNAVNAFNVNTADYIHDLVTVLDLVKSTIDVKHGNLKEAIKSASNTYLSIKYGWENLFRDTAQLGADIGTEITRRPWSTTRGGSSQTYKDYKHRVWSNHTWCIIEYSTFGDLSSTAHIPKSLYRGEGEKFIDAFYNFNIGTAETLWDIIPFSFVVDWFIGVGDALQMADARLHAYFLPVSTCTITSKQTCSGSMSSPIDYLPSGPNIKGSWSIQLYKRDIRTDIPEIRPQISNESKGLNGHWAEATALIIQKL